MSRATGIEWCDATFNPWWGCERVSPACAHCYADTFARRLGMPDLWANRGEHTFRFFGDKHWEEPYRWARLAIDGRLPDRSENKDGHRPRVFCASMADVFEDHPDLEAPRTRLFVDVIGGTPELDWLVLTKRPEFAAEWLSRFYAEEIEDEVPWPNVWLGVSIENARYTWRADVLREIPAAVRFISAEPLLGSLFDDTVGRIVRERGADHDGRGGIRRPAGIERARSALDLSGIDWVIAGGESGPGARPFRLDHVRELVEQIYSYRAHEHRGYGPPAIFIKQLGASPLGAAAVAGDPLALTGDRTPLKLHDRKGGDWNEWPPDLRIREFPAPVLEPE